MCGIAGLVTQDGSPPDAGVLDRLAGALAHRGPDGQGRHVRNGVGLVQTRLAIIDLEGGRQPIFDAGGNAIIANGEIYNYIELKAGMGEIRFATGSDCEPPLHLHREQGAHFAEALRGMYAIAIDDAAHDRVVLARDPFGIKPLYMAQGEFGLAFASEPQALIAAGLVRPEVNFETLAQHLQLQFATGAETIFSGVERVLPGETLAIEGGRIVERSRIAALPQGGTLKGSTEDLLRELDRVLMEAVDIHQRSDVPYGMFLSGGIDSSVVLAMMARLNPRPVLAFTAGFSGTGVHDERDHARAVAAAAGARHVEVDFSEDDFWALSPAVAAAMDDPAADYACLPTYKLAQVASKDVKVILSGEGGDELFAGYGRYRSATRPWPLARPMRRRGTFDRYDVLKIPLAGWRDGIARAEQAEALSGRSRLQTVQAVDCADWLPNDLLVKADRCLMAHGVEGRVPFLDREVAAFAYRLPDALKIKRDKGKWLLRRWLATALPEAKPFEPKRGFTVPVAEWIAKRPEVGQLVARQELIAGIAKPGAVEKLFKSCNGRTGFACWTLLFTALWHQRHILGRPADGDVFAVLDQG